jgi:hypothetical protein
MTNLESAAEANARAEFAAAYAEMEPLLERLGAAPLQRVADHLVIPQVPGIYLFRDDGTPIYVGQSRNLRRRLRIHTRPTSRHNQASFAFNLARREAAAADIDIHRPRAHLAADPAFEAHFADARARVAAMHVQFIDVESPITRTMFEMFAALVLDTAEFNSFETH